MNSFRMSFWMVPDRSARGTPCSSPATMKLAKIAHNARVIRVIAAVGGKIESHRDALLPSGKVLAVKRVRRFGGRESRILPDGPRPPRIHRGAHAAREGGHARQLVHLRQAFDIGLCIQRLDGDALKRVPDQRIGRLPFQLFRGKRRPSLDVCHDLLRAAAILLRPVSFADDRKHGIEGLLMTPPLGRQLAIPRSPPRRECARRRSLPPYTAPDAAAVGRSARYLARTVGSARRWRDTDRRGGMAPAECLTDRPSPALPATARQAPHAPPWAAELPACPNSDPAFATERTCLAWV